MCPENKSRLKSIKSSCLEILKNKFLIYFIIVIGTSVTISCVTAVKRTVIAPPHIPGAQFVGSQNCIECHEDITSGFHNATHALLVAEGNNAVEMGCESCHGPGSIHSDTGGAYHSIINPGESPETCFQCHLDKRGEFSLPFSHAVLEGKMGCGDCHSSHEGPATIGGGMSLASENETCFECHMAQRGPFVFEHEALREGCTSCHSSHGSVNAKMLKSRNANLCLQCHFQQQTAPDEILIGGRNHANFLPRGTCWTAGCHEAVHGSHVSPSMRFD